MPVRQEMSACPEEMGGTEPQATRSWGCAGCGAADVVPGVCRFWDSCGGIDAWLSER